MFGASGIKKRSAARQPQTVFHYSLSRSSANCSMARIPALSISRRIFTLGFSSFTSIAAKARTASTLWISPNTGATNESSFSGLPGGSRNYSGAYVAIGGYGLWWSSTEAWSRHLESANGNSKRDTNAKQIGFSVRCLRD